MRTITAPVLALCCALLSAGCSCMDNLDPSEPRNCPQRTPYYPDQDGDGLGATSAVYLGCEPLEGYVAVSGDCDDADPDITACADTGDTGPGDTGPGDTGPGDTGPGDSTPDDSGDSTPGDSSPDDSASPGKKGAAQRKDG